MKKSILITLFSLFLYSCSIEERIREYSYTDYWYLEQGLPHQVYKTKKGKYYIIVYNKKETQLKRKYIEDSNFIHEKLKK